MKRIIIVLLLAAAFVIPQSVEARHHGRNPHVIKHHKHSHHQVSKARAKSKAKHATHKRRSVGAR
jgi:Ni/Co efflux regulator RcnB